MFRTKREQKKKKKEEEYRIKKEKKEWLEILRRQIGDLEINQVNEMKHDSNYYLFITKKILFHIMKFSPFRKNKI